MPTHFADRLLTAIQRKGAPVCVGLDPLVERLPTAVLKACGLRPGGKGGPDKEPQRAACALRSFCMEVIGAVADRVPAIKINVAFFERYGSTGVQAYREVVRFAAGAELLVIGDIKRGDIGHSSSQYAMAHLAAGADTGFSGPPDAVTVNPYFGLDGVRPFLDVAGRTGRGLFVLVQTSNESAAQVQGLALSDGSTVGEAVARLVQRWAVEEGSVGSAGYSNVGAVVSPRDLAATDSVRALMPNCIFLVPGFGTQGRTPEQVAHCFKADGTGALVTASRSVIYAYQNQPDYGPDSEDWRIPVERAAGELVDSVRRALPGTA